MIEILKAMNEDLIKKNKNKPDALKIQQQIKAILSEDDCFLNMPIELAYSILRDLNVSENKLKDTYLQLIEYKK